MTRGGGGPSKWRQRVSSLVEWLRSSEKKRRTLKSPGGGTFVAFLLIVAGTLGSLYSTEIRSATPFAWPSLREAEIAWSALQFWFFVVLTSGLFFLRQQAVDESINELVEVLRSQPPSDLLGVFKETYEKCDRVARVESQPNRAELAKKIRAVLTGLATLARRFDGEAESVRYATNIMIFVPTAHLTPTSAQVKQLEAFLLHRDPETSLEKYRGILLLEHELSTVVPSGDPDMEVKRIAFQIPHTANLKTSGGKWRVIPGAPMAFIKGDCDGYADANRLTEWVRANSVLGDDFVRALDKYFREHGAQVQSFVSLALSDGSGSEPLGVVNIHRNRPDMLRAEQKLKHFLPLVAPFVLLLHGLVKEWTEIPEVSQNQQPASAIAPSAS